MRAAVPAVSAVALVLFSSAVFIGDRLAAPERQAPDARPMGAESLQAKPVEAAPVDAEPVHAGAVLPSRAAAPETPRGPPPAASRLIAPGVVAPPQLDPDALQREAPRAPLSALSAPAPPKPDRQERGRLFRPLAVASAVVEAMGRRVTIAGTESLAVEETCAFEGRPWACGMRARTAFRMWLRGRALDCDLPPDAGAEVTASCRLGSQDAGAWLVSNGWARAAPGGPYAQAEAEARAAGRGLFGSPPAALPPAAGATAAQDAAAARPPAGQPVPAR